MATHYRVDDEGQSPGMVSYICGAIDDDDSIFYGAAIIHLTYRVSTGDWIADNDEYGTRIQFCPWCGRPLDGPPSGGDEW